MFIGWSGQAFQTDITSDLAMGETMSIRQFTLRVDNLSIDDTPNYQADKATIGLYEYGKKVANLYPQKRLYKAGPEPQPTTEVAIYSTLKEDVYVHFAAVSRDGSKATIQVFYNPLVMWVWIGGVVLGLGTLIALLPNKTGPSRRRINAEKTEEPKAIEANVS
jgi:cytochrome c-type biogenesis protein CcmF